MDAGAYAPHRSREQMERDRVLFVLAQKTLAKDDRQLAAAVSDLHTEDREAAPKVLELVSAQPQHFRTCARLLRTADPRA
jgi:hypothetical protein